MRQQSRIWHSECHAFVIEVHIQLSLEIKENAVALNLSFSRKYPFCFEDGDMADRSFHCDKWQNNLRKPRLYIYTLLADIIYKCGREHDAPNRESSGGMLSLSRCRKVKEVLVCPRGNEAFLMQ